MSKGLFTTVFFAKQPLLIVSDSDGVDLYE